MAASSFAVVGLHTHVCCVNIDSIAYFADIDRAAAEAGLKAFRSALGMTGLEQPAAGPFADACSMQGSILAAPEALQGKQLRLGKKVLT